MRRLAIDLPFDGLQQILGMFGAALTFALGGRMAGILLEDFDGPLAILWAFLTALEARQLPRAVPQAIHTRPPLGGAAKELCMTQAAGCRLRISDLPEHPRLLRETMIRPLSCMCPETLNF